MAAMHLLFLTLLLLIPAATDKHACLPAQDSQQTIWGHSQLVLDFRDKPVKAAKGTIESPDGKPVESVLVEVFARAEGDPPPDGEAGPPSAKRIAACVTSANGLFVFNIPSGHYEIRASKADWNATSVLITVDTRKGKKTNLNVRLEVGT